MIETLLKKEYRYDIQGLRAISALLIMVFHIWLNKVSGGVDVFFVVSGYFMASVLLRDYFQLKTYNPFLFWGGVLKRISPSAYTVLFVTLIAIAFISPSFIKTGFYKEVVASSIHIENLYMILTSTDYLASTMPKSPVQQFWALSIQIQFYLILPFILIPLVHLAKRLQSIAPLAIGVCLVIIASFIYANILVGQNAAVSYFHPLSRIWEFFFGILAFLITLSFKTVRFRGFLSITGLALIFGGAFLIPKGASFSGAVSLIPVLGALLVIISGTSGSGVGNRLLSSPSLVSLGNLSFSIYLWHWPILVFYKQIKGSDSVLLFDGILIIFISILLAYCTYRLIEQPLKKIPRKKVIKNFLISALFFLPTIFISLLGYYGVLSNNKEIIKFDPRLARQHSNVGTSLFIAADNKLSIDPIKLNYAANAKIPYTADCHQEDVSKADLIMCRLGNQDAQKKLVLAGSSHILQWLPYVESFAIKNNYEVIAMTKGYCPLGPIQGTAYFKTCQKWNQKVLEKIQEIKPYAVITNSTITSTTDQESIPSSFIETWKYLADKDIKLVGVRDNPRFSYSVPMCLYAKRNNLSSTDCSVDKSNVYQAVDPTAKYGSLIKSIDVSEFFCISNNCLAHFSGIPMFRDSNHISEEYGYFIEKDFIENLEFAIR